MEAAGGHLLSTEALAPPLGPRPPSAGAAAALR